MRKQIVKSALLAALVCFFWNQANAQSPEKLYERAMKAFYAEDFQAAVILFSEIEETGKSYKDSEYRLEISLLVQKEYRERPLANILKYRDIKKKTDKFYDYWMGRIYANRYLFPEAVESWKMFLGRKEFKSKEIKEETRSFIQKAENLVFYFDNPDNYEIYQLDAPINTEFAELTPVYSTVKDELLFASNRADIKMKEYIIYHALNEDSEWSKPTAIKELGTFDRKTANVEVVNEDGKLFLFRDEKKGDLYYSQPDPLSKNWTVPKEFDSEITSTRLGSHFFINEHEDRIIFSAPNKKIGLDLLESFKNPKSGKWSKPHPFSSAINSLFDEDSPYLSADEKKFYFSSNRPGGVGGYDIFMSEYDEENNTWTDPVNMGWPINSPDDELHFKFNPDLSSGYFTSNRIHSRGDHDIFFFWSIEKTVIQGRIIDALTQQPITNGEIRFHPSKYLDEYFRSTIDSTGRYRTDIISNETFKIEVVQGFDTIHFETFEIHDSEGERVTHIKDFYVIPKNLGAEKREELEAKYATTDQPGTTEESNNEKVAEETAPEPKSKPNIFVDNGKPIFLHNIYFEFGTSTMSDESEPVLTQLYEFLKEKSSMRIEVGGHTDIVGSRQANLIISKKRAETVKNWLVKKGLDSERIETKGYGEDRPIASNDDEENGRELNRRIEITVLK